MKIAVLGTTGMLGSTVAKFLSGSQSEVWEFNRSGKSVVEGNRSEFLDVTKDSSITDFLENSRFDYVINCIGLIKQLINDKSDEQVKLAYKLNSEFPSMLDQYSHQTSTKVIQIGTDCVFSGLRGNYDESSEFDCTDIYGLSKVEGESRSKGLMTIRTSIIGRELNSSVSLMDWLINQKPNSKVHGFVNHFWNGVTTLDFARVVDGVIKESRFRPGVIHLIPKNQITKYELLGVIAKSFNRTDLCIEPFSEINEINRTLSSIFPDENSALWSHAGYVEPPTISEMVQNYAHWAN
jgi:dTDP-4-dehydrorhamnose reductase